MSVSVFSRNKVGTADELTLVATKNNQRVYVGTKKAVEAAILDKNIGENSVVYITDDYKEKTTEQVPVGTIMPYAGKVSPKGYLLCNGASFDKTAYPELFDVLGVNTTPNLTGRFLMGSGTEAAGTYVDEQLPNIKGRFDTGLGDSGAMARAGSADGAFATKRIYNDKMYALSTYSSTTYTPKYDYDASKTLDADGKQTIPNPAYKDPVDGVPVKVRPDSFVVTYIIKAE